jgi:hypothetical protein
MLKSRKPYLRIKRRWIAGEWALLCIAVFGISAAASAASRGPCDDSLTQRIPVRPGTAPTGRQFAAQIEGLSAEERETFIRHELLAGNIPEFLRRLVPIHFTAQRLDGHLTQIVVCAAPDYLAIGSDGDFFLMPMRLETALLMASEFGLTLPTPKIVDAIYAQAVVHFAPQPLPASDAMRSTDYYQHHNDMIAAQRVELGALPGALSAGHKKDLVLTNRLWANLDRVAIYGWQLSNGVPIQPLSTVHGWRYADYSHGARLISARAFVDGLPRSILEILQDPQLARALSNEGTIANVGRLVVDLSAGTHAIVASLLPDAYRGAPE